MTSHLDTLGEASRVSPLTVNAHIQIIDLRQTAIQYLSDRSHNEQSYEKE
jgi:hypothetical protein